MGQGTGLRSSFTQVSYDHVSPTSPRLFLFVCLDQFKKKKIPHPKIENVFLWNWKQTHLMALTSAGQCVDGWWAPHTVL